MHPAGQVTGGSAPFPFRLCSQEAEAPLLPPLAQGPAKPTSLRAPGVTPHLQELNRMCLRVFQKEVTDYQPSKSSCNKVKCKLGVRRSSAWIYWLGHWTCLRPNFRETPPPLSQPPRAPAGRGFQTSPHHLGRSRRSPSRPWKNHRKGTPLQGRHISGHLLPCDLCPSHSLMDRAGWSLLKKPAHRCLQEYFSNDW